MTVFETAKTVPALDCAEKYTSEKMTRKGKKTWCCCPFHSEKTASCAFFEDTGAFYCFGCHSGGDSIEFVSKLFSISRYEASKKICADFGLSFDSGAPMVKAVIEQSQQREFRDALNISASFVNAVWCGKKLWCDDRIREAERIDDEDRDTWLIEREKTVCFLDELQEVFDDENALYEKLTEVKDQTLLMYEHLKLFDDTCGTSYVRGVSA